MIEGSHLIPVSFSEQQVLQVGKSYEIAHSFILLPREVAQLLLQSVMIASFFLSAQDLYRVSNCRQLCSRSQHPLVKVAKDYHNKTPLL